MPVLSFVGTGIGAVGFVIFFGGFVLWTRFDSSGLPANEAVAQVPRNDLIVTGASFLVPALLAALAAVAGAFVGWDALIGKRHRHKRADAKRARSGQAREIGVLRDRAARIEQEIVTAQAQIERHDNEAKEAPAGAARDAARQRFDASEAEEKRLRDELTSLQETDIPNAQRVLDEAEAAEGGALDLTRSEHILRAVIGGIPMVTTEALVIGAGWPAFNLGPKVLLIVVAGATVAVAVVVVSLTGSTGWYAAFVFGGVGLLIAFSTYERTHDTTKVSPVAAIQGDEPVTGFFVAETSDAVYIGRPSRKPGNRLLLDHHAIALVRVPKGSTIDLTVGPLMGETEAYTRSLQLALSLCQQPAMPSKADQASKQPSATLSACGLAAIHTLETKLGIRVPHATRNPRRHGKKPKHRLKR